MEKIRYCITKLDKELRGLDDIKDLKVTLTTVSHSLPDFCFPRSPTCRHLLGCLPYRSWDRTAPVPAPPSLPETNLGFPCWRSQVIGLGWGQEACVFSNYPEGFLGSGWFKASALRIKSSLPSQPDLSCDDVLTHLSHPESVDS